MSDALIKEQQISNNYYKEEEVITARVVANYGDPGLDGDYFFDIQSRFVVVMIESINRIPTTHKNKGLFAIVRRPQHLWISSQGSIPASGLNTADLKRADALGNVNTGSYQSYTVSSIPRINFPYRFGERISIRKLKKRIRLDDSSFFGSAFHKSYFANHAFNSSSYYNEGLPNAYIDSSRETETRKKAIRPAVDNGVGYYQYPVNGGAGVFVTPNEYTYYMAFNKFQFELFWLHTHSGSYVTNALAIFNSQDQNGSNAQMARQGGYYFNSYGELGLSICSYEDINVGGKFRTTSSECMPLIVTTPNTFPTPSRREIGTILYDPTYETVQQ